MHPFIFKKDSLVIGWANFLTKIVRWHFIQVNSIDLSNVKKEGRYTEVH